MKNLEIKNVDCHAMLAMTKNTQSGRSMIEMLGVLAIIGVLSVGGIAGYSKAMMKYRINKTIEQITLIAGNVRTFFATQNSYEGVGCYCETGMYSDNEGNDLGKATFCKGQKDRDGCPVIKKANILPDEMLTLNNGKISDITDQFGNRVTLYTENRSVNSDHKAFCLSFWALPQEACIELLTYDWTTANVGAIHAYPYGVYNMWKALQPPVDIDKAINYCRNSVNYMHFYFDIDKSSTYWQNRFNQSDD